MPARLPIAALLLGSGMCALVYQVAWLRELRLVFGASTPASAAVLAVFMAGLGAGSAVLGKRADRRRRPLLLYSKLEAGITAAAAITPLLLVAVRALYVALGGTTTLGTFFGTIVRLLLSALVLLAPTFLMGGTLPAAARAAMPSDDEARRSTALLYGANTLGAVIGAALSTFLLLEVFGTRFTLWLGCSINALVAVLARMLDRRLGATKTPATERARGARAADGADERPDRAASGNAERAASAQQRFVLVAAAAVGFVFLLMELCWYRMLAPLLGGSTYTFGLILAIALLGIGLGGLVYAGRDARQPPRLSGFAFSCGLEAVLLALPFALGDRVAMLALLLRTFGVYGLAGHALAWSVIAALVVLPAAIVAGYQFPLLISLLGRGGADVGRHVGTAYASNTVGAIAGSLTGGFIALPLLSAPGTWTLAVWLLVLLAGAALAVELRRVRAPATLARRGALPAGVALAALGLMHLTVGPTAVWRHSPIGAGRSDELLGQPTANRLERYLRGQRLGVTWQVDGRESSVAMYTLNDTAFLVSGKSDGAAVEDSGTQVMSGMLGALLQPRVERAMVIGLGTGSTAGWLGAVDSIAAVDVVEIEPAILEVARVCTPVNHGVLDNPKVNVSIGDAREVLLTTPHRYDLVFSEPSNPYRAGIASLFTQEFYQAVRDRLRPGGVFIQWVQAYEIDATSVRTVYRTLTSVFPSVETWRTDATDLVLISRLEDRPLDVAELRQRITQEPFKSGLMAAWRARSVEGVLARYVAQPALAAAIAQHAGPWAVNTDDRNLLEFGVARSLGRPQLFRVEDLEQVARDHGLDKPRFADPTAAVDWEAVETAHMLIGMIGSATPAPLEPRDDSDELEKRYQAARSWRRNDPMGVLDSWAAQSREAEAPVELMLLADAHAAVGNEPAALELAERLSADQPTEALAVEARLRWTQSRPDEALRAFEAALESYRVDPWPNNLLMARLLPLAEALAEDDAELVPRLIQRLSLPLGVNALRHQRERTRFRVALWSRDPADCVAALAAFEPDVPWERDHLRRRAQCYGRAGHPKTQAALDDLNDFIEHEGTLRDDELLPPPAAAKSAAP